jgi:putative protein-disulfide isomerase
MTLLYVYDPLCGWCYGFSKIITEFANNHKSDFDVQVISGGMVVNDRVGPLADMAHYISNSYKTVEEKTGIEFGDAFLNKTMVEGTVIFDSLPPSIALTIFKESRPKDQLAFASRIQRAIYYDGVGPTNIEHYAEIAEEFGLERTAFLEKMNDEKYLAYTRQDFELSGKLGVTGFPTTVLYANDQFFALGRGAVGVEVLEENYKIALSSIKERAEN